MESSSFYPEHSDALIGQKELQSSDLPYRWLVGLFMYLHGNLSNIMLAVCKLSQFMNSIVIIHWMLLSMSPLPQGTHTLQLRLGVKTQPSSWGSLMPVMCAVPTLASLSALTASSQIRCNFLGPQQTRKLLLNPLCDTEYIACCIGSPQIHVVVNAYR